MTVKIPDGDFSETTDEVGAVYADHQNGRVFWFPENGETEDDEVRVMIYWMRDGEVNGGTDYFPQWALKETAETSYFAYLGTVENPSEELPCGLTIKEYVVQQVENNDGKHAGTLIWDDLPTE